MNIIEFINEKFGSDSRKFIEVLRKVSYNASYEFTHIIFKGSYFISSYYNTGTSFIIQLDSKRNYNLNRFRDIVYLQKNVPIIIRLSPNCINPTKLQGVILNIDYDLEIEKLTVVFE